MPGAGIFALQANTETINAFPVDARSNNHPSNYHGQTHPTVWLQP